MRVRCVNLLGPAVYEASFVEFPDEMSDDPDAKKLVLQIQSPEPLAVESYSADELEIVEASEAEWKQLDEQGFHDVQRPG